MRDERKHFMDLMTDAFKTQGHPSPQSHIWEIKVMVYMEAAGYSTIVKELWENQEQQQILLLILQVRPLTDLF